MVDIETQEQLIWFDGLLTVPIGTIIHIDNQSGGPPIPLDPEQFPSGSADAKVVEVRIWATQTDESCLCLYVQLNAPGESDWDYGEQRLGDPLPR
jgi:hypothetical protein